MVWLASIRKNLWCGEAEKKDGLSLHKKLRFKLLLTPLTSMRKTTKKFKVNLETKDYF